MTAADTLAQLARGKPSPPLREVDRAFARLLQRMGGTPEVALAGALAMRAVSLGHGGFPLAGARALLDELDADAALPDADAWADALRASPLVAAGTEASAPLVFEHDMVALRRYARYEQRLADALRNRRGVVAEAVDDDALARLFALPVGRVLTRHPDDGDARTRSSGDDSNNGDNSGGSRPALQVDRQALAAWTVLRQRLTLVTGGPGTGKTTTVARMLALLAARTPTDEAQIVRIALAAPTGRAAARLGEAVADALTRDVEAGRLDADIAARVPRQAQTLHRLLGWQRSGAFRHDAALPLPYDVVVVDEASMVDLPMMARLVDAVAPDARLVLLGDPDQLPAVEAGDVLGALCAAAGDGLAVPAEFEALAASGDPSDHHPHNLSDRHPHNLSDRHPRESGDPWTFRDEEPMSTDSRLRGSDEQVVAVTAPLTGHRIHLTRGYRQANAAGVAKLARAVQHGEAADALNLLRNGTDGVHWIDAPPTALERHLETEVLPAYRALAQAEDPRAALRLAARVRVLTALRHGPAGAAAWNAWFARRLGHGDAWFRGRLLMVTANSYRHRLFNGDTGVCWPDADGHPVVWFEQDGQLVPWSPGQLPQHDTAFATTVHKAQGSEFDDVWLLLPARDNRVLSRELVYTGITRARKELHVAGSAEVIETALGRHASRWSGLGWRLGS
ncbi:AAA family ATPase [Luteimonas soli]|uniref:RecBCD enzyme subunit RecD n=1 Tax=Luteimonas soli TaxID=1648966 RepID=A0ABV7XK24_9GAMM